MPIWLNILLVLALCGLVLWGMRGLAKSIDRSMAEKGEDEAPAVEDVPDEKLGDE